MIVSCNNSEKPAITPIETLDAPTSINVDKRILTWNAIENASGYLVSFENVEYETTEPTLNLDFQIDGGEYDVRIKTIGDGENFRSSDWSEAVTFTLSERVTVGYDETGCKYTLLEDGSGYELTDATRSSALKGVFTVPDYFEGYPVKRIGTAAFFRNVMGFDYFTEAYCNVVTTGVKLPSQLESIGVDAFYGLVRLEEIVIPDTVTEIGDGAFEGCTRLTRAVLPKGLKVIPKGCFNNTALNEINLPDGLEEIGSSAFSCTYEEHQFGQIEYKKGSCTFSEPNMVMCHINSELSSVVIPSSVKHIGHHAFSGREKLENFVIPSTVEFIDGRIFDETKWFENQPDGFLFIGEGNCFLYGYKGEIPNGVIDNIPSHVTGICGFAFEKSNLKKIVIPDGVKLIGEYTFRNCSDLSEVYLPSDLENIPGSSFFCTPSLKSITLPKTLTQIGVLAFYDSGLEKITIPGSCKTIGNGAFLHCINLSEVVLEEGIETIGAMVFSGTAVKNIVWPKSLKT
jgi:hypothetical protein